MHPCRSCIVSVILVATPLAQANEATPPGLVTFTSIAGAPDGAWCWFQDERVIVDTEHAGGPLLLLGSVSFSAVDAREHGDIDLLWFNTETGEQGAFELHDQLEPDDHDAPSLNIRDDGRYLALYSKHSTDRLLRWRVSARPHDPTAWEPQETFSAASSICYSNLLPAEAVCPGEALISFSRADGYDPNYYLSADGGETWSYGGRLLTGPGGNEANQQRPYLKYAASSEGAIHFLASGGHPRNQDNGVYHGFIREGQLHWSDGTVKGALSSQQTSPHRANEFTSLITAGSRYGGASLHNAWPIDLHVDDAGRPYALFQARVRGDTQDHRFLYGRWNGERWRTFDIAQAGGSLYDSEQDYTGLGALHPHDPDTLFVCTPIDPRNSSQLAHYELFMGVTSDGGASWTWTPITWDSQVDNLRPVVPVWPGGRTALLWLRGTITSYRDWNSQIVGIIRDTEALHSLRVPGEAAITRSANAADQPAPALTTLAAALDPAAVLDAGQRVAHWQLANLTNPPTYGRYVSWTKHRRQWEWAPFYIGLSLFATKCQDESLLEQLDCLLADIGWEMDQNLRNADNWAIGWAYADAYRRHGEAEMVAGLRAQFDDLMQQSWDESLEWINRIQTRELAWCDALYMGPPTLMHLAAVTGEERYAEFGDRLWWKTTDYLYDAERHFYYRDSRYFDAKEENGAPIFWSRGNGWIFAGLPRILEDLPEDHPKRASYERLFKEMAGAVRAAQQDSGYWPAGLLDPEHWTAAETSGTAFFTYGLAWGVNRGLLDPADYRPAVERGWGALIRSLRPDGWLRDVQPVGADPYDFNPESVMPYAVGGFLMAASEVHALAAEDRE